MLLDKKNALYVKACIIANGITDTQGDTLYAEDIKKIFTSFNNQDNFEMYHDEIPVGEVSLLENYISLVDETIGTAVVPTGSWMAIIRVDNPDIKNKLLTNQLGGVSLNNRIAKRCKANLKGTIRYKDIADAECVVPLFISFVEGGANGYGLHVMDYPAYIKKSKDEKPYGGNKMMDFKEFLNGLKSLIKEAEDTPEEEPVIEKEDETKKDEEDAVETPATEEKEAEEETDKEDEPAIKKDDKTAEEEDKEEVVEETEDETKIVKDDKATEDDFEAKVTAIIEKVLAEKFPEETEEEETDDESEEEAEKVEDEDTPKITKSEKVVFEDKTTPSHTNYYSVTGRDPLTGKKIRN